MVGCVFAEEYECQECPRLGSTSCPLIPAFLAEFDAGRYLEPTPVESDVTPRELREAERETREYFLNRVAEATIAALSKHGVPTHWRIVAEMVRHEPEMASVPPMLVYHVLVVRKDLFEAPSPGVYALAPDSAERGDEDRYQG